MTRSLERSLIRTMLLVIVFIGVFSGAISYIFAFEEAQEFQDNTLLQIASLADIRYVFNESPDINSISTSNNGDEDTENHVMVIRLQNDKLPANIEWTPSDLSQGFQTVGSPQGHWRVYVQKDKTGERIAVAQLTEVRNEAASDSAQRTLVPLGILLPLLIMFTIRIVRKQFVTVRLLAHKLDEQPPDRPTTLPETGLPDEISPFVRSINNLLKKIIQLMGEQRRFIAEAAHELRSPLTALSLQAQNLENADTLDEMRERVRPLRAGIERSRRLTEQLLNLARSQESSPVFEMTDISKLVRDLISEYLPVAEARGIDLGMNENGDICLYTEPHTLRLVLKNALDNALSYSQSSGQVTARSFVDNNDAVIEISDTGPGIPESEIERVFDPFYRVEGSIGDGSGLGLAIAQTAARRLGGEVCIYNRSGGKGVIFQYRQRLHPEFNR